MARSSDFGPNAKSGPVPKLSGYQGRPEVVGPGQDDAIDPERSMTAFVATAGDAKPKRVLTSMCYLSRIRILPMTSKSVPLGSRTKKSPMAIDGSRTTLEMLRSWVIITRFAEERWLRMSCKTRS
jgi:hypothetical protein